MGNTLPNNHKTVIKKGSELESINGSASLRLGETIHALPHFQRLVLRAQYEKASGRSPNLKPTASIEQVGSKQLSPVYH